MYNYGFEFDHWLNRGSEAWSAIAIILAITGAILTYFLFIKSDKKYGQKFVDWLRNFLNFEEMIIEPILKMSYIFFAIFITLTSFNFISYSFPYFLIYLIGGNLLVRVAYESIMVLIGIWKNTKEINKKMK